MRCLVVGVCVYCLVCHQPDRTLSMGGGVIMGGWLSNGRLYDNARLDGAEPASTPVFRQRWSGLFYFVQIAGVLQVDV
jgi:hypothetical protein